MRDFFESKGIGYLEHDVSADPKALQRLMEISGQTDRPAIIVNGRIFLGFDRSQLENVVPSRH